MSTQSAEQVNKEMDEFLKMFESKLNVLKAENEEMRKRNAAGKKKNEAQRKRNAQARLISNNLAWELEKIVAEDRQRNVELKEVQALEKEYANMLRQHEEALTEEKEKYSKLLKEDTNLNILGITDYFMATLSFLEEMTDACKQSQGKADRHTLESEVFEKTAEVNRTKANVESMRKKLHQASCHGTTSKERTDLVKAVMDETKRVKKDILDKKMKMMQMRSVIKSHQNKK